MWPRGGPGSWAHQCCLQHKHRAASHIHCWLLSVLCHPSPVPRSRRARMLHQTISRASQPLPIPLPAITSVPKLKPSPLFKLPFPPTLLPGTQASTADLVSHIPAHCTRSWGQRKKTQTKPTTEVSQAPGQPDHHQPVPRCARFTAGHAGLQHPWHGDLPGWVLSGVTVLLLAGFASSVG